MMEGGMAWESSESKEEGEFEWEIEIHTLTSQIIDRWIVQIQSVSEEMAAYSMLFRSKDPQHWETIVTAFLERSRQLLTTQRDTLRNSGR